ncbi:MAG: hypothetical protein ACRELE_05500, partial [Gemmatimonadales bacterium]
VLMSQPADRSLAPLVMQRRMSVASGWAFIHPFVPVIGRTAGTWTAIWIVWWFGLLGWTASWLSGLRLWLPGLAALGAFGAVSWWIGLPLRSGEVALGAAAYLAAVLVVVAIDRSRSS